MDILDKAPNLLDNLLETIYLTIKYIVSSRLSSRWVALSRMSMMYFLVKI